MGILRKITEHRAGGLVESFAGSYGTVISAASMARPRDYEAPVQVDNRMEVLPIDNQGRWPACVSYTVAGLIEAHYWKAQGRKVQIDPMPIHRRAIEKQGAGTIETSGTTLEVGLGAAQDLGILPASCRFFKIDTLSELRLAIHRYNHVVTGWRITEGWNQVARYPTATGATYPALADSTKFIGGHAVLTSYYDTLGTFGGPNQWGLDWGLGGYWRLTPAQAEMQFMYGIAVEFLDK